MNTEKQRIEIALACGWTDVRHESNYFGGRSTPRSTLRGNNHKGNRWEIPDYLNDLNAIHHAVKSLPQNLMPRYFACLCNVVSGSLSLYGYSKATEATAAQRCEAFLKTLDKWTNDR